MRPLLISTIVATLVPVLVAAPVEILPPALRGAVQPQVAVAPSGRIHVVFGRDNAIYHTSSPDGRVFSGPIKVGELAKLALRMRRGPRVTATDQRVFVTAISHADGNVHAWTSTDAGATWGETPPLNTVPYSAREGLQALAGDGRGLVVAVWLDLRGGAMELWGRTSRDGGATWAPDEAIYRSPDGHVCECCVPGVAISPTRKVAAMWRNWLGGSRDLYLAISPDGRAFSEAQKLGTGTWKLSGCPMDGGAVAFTPSGDWFAVWRRERGIYSSDAKVPELPLATDAAQPLAAFAGETRLVLWEARGALVLQRGSDAPVVFAESAAAASIVSGPEAAAVAWEGSVNGTKTIVFDRLR